MWKQGFLQSLLLNIATVSKCQRPLLNAFCVKSIPCTMRCTSNYPMPPTLYNHSVPKSHLKLPETTTLFRRIIFPVQILQGQKRKSQDVLKSGTTVSLVATTQPHPFPLPVQRVGPRVKVCYTGLSFRTCTVSAKSQGGTTRLLRWISYLCLPLQ